MNDRFRSGIKDILKNLNEPFFPSKDILKRNTRLNFTIFFKSEDDPSLKTEMKFQKSQNHLKCCVVANFNLAPLKMINPSWHRMGKYWMKGNGVSTYFEFLIKYLLFNAREVFDIFLEISPLLEL